MRRGGGVDEQAGVQSATLPPVAGRDKWKGSRDRSGIGIPRIDDEEVRRPEWCFVAGRDREMPTAAIAAICPSATEIACPCPRARMTTCA
jgi:hypothetical protein